MLKDNTKQAHHKDSSDGFQKVIGKWTHLCSAASGNLTAESDNMKLLRDKC